MKSMERYSIKDFDDNVVALTKKHSAVLAESLMEICSLYTLSKRLSVSLDIDECFAEAEELLKSSLGIDSFSIMLLDEESSSLSLWKASHSTMKAARDVSFRLGEGISGIVASTGKPVLASDVTKDIRFLHYKGTKQETGSFYSTPLKVSDKVLGVFNVSKREPDSISDGETLLYNATAGHIALALENSNRFQKTRLMAITDELTTLYSRRFFFESLDRELSKAKRLGSNLSLIMFDMDDFKKINDIHGHMAGDETLRELGAIFKGNTRRGDVAARYGGEEFILLLPGTGMKDAVAIGNKIRAIVAKDLVIEHNGKGPFGVTISGGVSTYPDNGKTGDELVEHADGFLLCAKGQGKNRVCSSLKAEHKRDVEEKRSFPRYGVRIVVNDRSGGLRLLDIQADSEWRMCAVENVSHNGFKGMVTFEPEIGKVYKCRAIIDSNKDLLGLFEITCARKRFVRDGRYMMGAKISGDHVSWKQTLELMY